MSPGPPLGTPPPTIGPTALRLQLPVTEFATRRIAPPDPLPAPTAEPGCPLALICPKHWMEVDEAITMAPPPPPPELKAAELPPPDPPIGGTSDSGPTHCPPNPGWPPP